MARSTNWPVGEHFSDLRFNRSCNTGRGARAGGLRGKRARVRCRRVRVRDIPAERDKCWLTSSIANYLAIDRLLLLDLVKRFCRLLKWLKGKVILGLDLRS